MWSDGPADSQSGVKQQRSQQSIAKGIYQNWPKHRVGGTERLKQYKQAKASEKNKIK